MTLVYLAAAWLAGILLAKTIPFPWQVLPALALIGLLGLLLWRDKPRVRSGALCTLALALGAGRFLLATPHFDETSLATYNDTGQIALEGVIIGEPDERETYTNLRLRAEHLTLPDDTERRIEGLALVKADPYPRRRYGDQIRVQGMLETPPVLKGFSYRDYLARQGIHSLVRHAEITLLAEKQAHPLLHHIFTFKRYAQSTIARILPEPQAALLTGILLGVETGIPADLMEDFAATGTTHIIAISGFNITIISGIFAGLAQQLFNRRRAIWVAIAGVAGYTIFVGASAAVVRAAIMGGLYLLARNLGRETYAPASLAAAAIGMTAWNPHTLWDVGFLLSFAATAGLVLYTEPLEQFFERALAQITSTARAQSIVDLISEALIVTLAAQITTTPIILHYFGRLSLITLVTNFFILPAQPGVMIWGGIATLLGLIVRPIGQVVGWIAWVFLTYTITVVRATARVPFASAPVQMESWMVFAYYALLGGFTWWLSQSRERRGELWDKLTARLDVKLLATAAAILLILAFSAWRALPDGRLHIVFLDVGEGDATFIQTPSGRQVLIGGGPSQSVLLSRLGRQMPFWDRTLDVLVLTHPGEAYLTGMIPVLERYRVETLIFRELGCEAEICTHWRRLVEAEGAAVHRAEAGLELRIDKAVVMNILHPGAELADGASFRDNSVVTRLAYGQTSVLLPGAIGAEVMQRMVSDDASPTSTVLKVPRQEHCETITEGFLESVEPDVAVVGTGEEDRFAQQPCDEMLERLDGLSLYRTDQHGTVEVISDGNQMWVETER